MNYKQLGFRAFLGKFCVLPLNDYTKGALESFPDADKANGILTYGYYDSQKGLTLEVIAAANGYGDNVKFSKTSKDIRSFIRMETVAELDCLFLTDDAKLSKKYKDKLASLSIYEANDEVKETRNMIFLDESRDQYYIDDVCVYLLKDGNKPEGCWTRIIGIQDNCIIGTLLTEPNQNFGYHAGQTIAFYIEKMEDERIICFSNMNPMMKLTQEDLEDGSILENAVRKFRSEVTNNNFIDALQLLRDSWVWIPCHAILSEADNKRLMEMAKQHNDNLDNLVDTIFTPEDDLQFAPDILTNGESSYFPVFTTKEAMGDYGNDFSKIQHHFLEVIEFARNSKKELTGIVLNPFSEPFILEKEIWDIVEKMKSRFSDQE